VGACLESFNWFNDFKLFGQQRWKLPRRRGALPYATGESPESQCGAKKANKNLRDPASWREQKFDWDSDSLSAKAAN
jgi:hypothetical protein